MKETIKFIIYMILITVVSLGLTYVLEK